MQPKNQKLDKKSKEHWKNPIYREKITSVFTTNNPMYDPILKKKAIKNVTKVRNTAEYKENMTAEKIINLIIYFYSRTTLFGIYQKTL